jgi:glycosyltransferase involved in cell wall biosynthesis
MKTILATVYAVDPYKGSENGMGWNFVSQIASNHKVFAVTRKNNREAIQKYQQENPGINFSNMTWLYYDLPFWLRFWKRGERGALLYYYLWQMFLPMFVLSNGIKVDIVHNVNFHNDWTPTFLWLLGKPLVWGPIGHHPKIPNRYAKKYGLKFLFKEQLKWIVKLTFWNLDPFLWITKIYADKILCMNSEVKNRLRFFDNKCELMPSVNAEELPELKNNSTSNDFTVLSVGRFVPLKGFDITLKSFILFYEQLSEEERLNVKLKLIGSGELEGEMERLIQLNDIGHAVELIPWMSRKDMLHNYGQSKVFFFPSHEGAGMVVAEAMSYGLPVVCFDNCGPGEFTDDNCSLKLNYTNYQQSVHGFSELLKKYYAEEATLKKHSSHARVRFQKNFLWGLRGLQLKHIYSDLNGKSYERKNNFRPSVQ